MFELADVIVVTHLLKCTSFSLLLNSISQGWNRSNLDLYEARKSCQRKHIYVTKCEQKCIAYCRADAVSGRQIGNQKQTWRSEMGNRQAGWKQVNKKNQAAGHLQELVKSRKHVPYITLKTKTKCLKSKMNNKLHSK